MENQNSQVLLGKIGKDQRGLYYDLYHQVTIGELTIEGSMGHDHYARLFGKARELLGIACIPGFVGDAGRNYKLLTCQANYSFKKNILFGDVIITRSFITKVGESSFEVSGEFINAKTGDVCATAQHMIVYADMAAKSCVMPPAFKSAIEAIKQGDNRYLS